MPIVLKVALSLCFANSAPSSSLMVQIATTATRIVRRVQTSERSIASSEEKCCPAQLDSCGGADATAALGPLPLCFALTQRRQPHKW